MRKVPRKNQYAYGGYIPEKKFEVVENSETRARQGTPPRSRSGLRLNTPSLSCLIRNHGYSLSKPSTPLLCCANLREPDVLPHPPTPRHALQSARVLTQ